MLSSIFTSEFFIENKDKIHFSIYLSLSISIAILSYFLKNKFLKLKSERLIIKSLQVLIKSIYYPILIFSLINVIANKDNFFLKYTDEYVITIISNIKDTGLVFLSWICFANLTSNIEKIITNKEKNQLEKNLLKLTIKILKFFSIATITLMILRLLGFNISTVIKNAGGSTAIITSAFLLIYKSQVSNIFSGFLVLMNKTFKINNRIVLPEKKIAGKILDMSLSKVKILTDDQKIITLPNSYLANTPYYNTAEFKNTFIKETIYLKYQDYEKVFDLNKSIHEYLTTKDFINQELPINVYTDEITTQSAITINIEFFANIINSSEIKKIKQEVLINAIKLCLENKCHIFNENE